MKVYQTKIKKLAGSDQHEVYLKSRKIYKRLARKTKRKPYVRSIYFNKEKIFLDYFWEHLYQKNPWDRFRRLKYYACAIDLIQHNRIDPYSVQNPNRSSQVLHRFEGKSKEGDSFFVQITEDKRTNQKYFISVFPK
jgi:hypothetical protein